MGRAAVTECMRVDGVEGPSGAEPLERVGWREDFWPGTDGDRCEADATMAADAKLLGRVTCERLAAARPRCEGEFPEPFSATAQHVVSPTPGEPDCSDTTVLRGDAVPRVARLQRRCERDVLVRAGPRPARTLIEHDRFDALHMLVHPVIVGAGKRLFDQTSDSERRRLVEARSVGDEGVEQPIHERGAP